MAITTSEAFLKALEKSSLLEPEPLAAARQSAGLTDDPRALAKALVQQGLLTRWQAGQLLIERPSFFVGKYKLIDLLGKGGMGRVFLARHTMMNRLVALKMIFEHLGQDPASLERFLAEARAIAALDHPNIVHAYNVDNEGDRYYLVMEYVEGTDLQRVVEKEGPLDFERAADYIRQAADGLAHAHAKGTVHGDIKPANLLVNQQGVIKILDLGMARLAADEKKVVDSVASDNRLLGTVDYMAPEQGIGGPGLDHRADIYSLGGTFYFLLTGHPPFPEGTLHERILKHQTEQPRSILSQRPGTPWELVKICQRMLAKAPADRFASAEEISRLLSDPRPTHSRIRRAVPLTEEEVQAMLPETSSDGGAVSPASTRLSGPRRRWRLLIGGGAAVVLLLLVAAAIVPVGGFRGRGEPHATESESNGGRIALAEPPKKEDDGWPGLKPLGDQAAPGPGPSSPGPAPTKPPDSAKSKPPDSAKSKPPDSAPTKPPDSTPPKPPAEKPGAGPAAPSPAGPPPSGDPFRDFPQAVDLPAIAERDPAEPSPSASATLARIDAADGVPWDLALLGKDSALKGARRLSLISKEADKKQDWIVRMESGLAKEAAQTDVARVWRDKQSLQFAWLDGAGPVAAGALRNCLLEVRVGTLSRTLALRKPLVMEPILLDLQRISSTLTIPLESMPESSQLRLQVVKIEGREGYLLNPAAPLSIRTPAALVFPRKTRQGRELAAVEYRLSLVAKRPKVIVDLRLLEPAPAQLRPIPSPDVRRSIEKRIQELSQQVAGPQPDPLKLQKINELEVRDSQIWYDDFIKAVHRKAKLHLRVFIEVEGRTLDLITTEAAAKPPDGKP